MVKTDSGKILKTEVSENLKFKAISLTNWSHSYLGFLEEAKHRWRREGGGSGHARYCKGLRSQVWGAEMGAKALVVEGLLILVHCLEVLPQQLFVSFWSILYLQLWKVHPRSLLIRHWSPSINRGNDNNTWLAVCDLSVIIKGLGRNKRLEGWASVQCWEEDTSLSVTFFAIGEAWYLLV